MIFHDVSAAFTTDLTIQQKICHQLVAAYPVTYFTPALLQVVQFSRFIGCGNSKANESVHQRNCTATHQTATAITKLKKLTITSSVVRIVAVMSNRTFYWVISPYICMYISFTA